MVNRRREKFTNVKMLSSRIELEDYKKLENILELKNLSVQQFLNRVVRNFISGTIDFSGSASYTK